MDFNTLKKANTHFLEQTKKISKVNDFLKEHNWLFIAPHFFIGFQIDQLAEISKVKDKNVQKDKIKDILYSAFFNLNWRSSFIEGYCIRCSHINPFAKSIEHSLILTFQRDYEGAIKTLIPIVEGILRDYLVFDKGRKQNEIRFYELKKAFASLKEDIIANHSNSFRNYTDENNRKVKFSSAELTELINIEKETYKLWFSFTQDFISNSFYLNTNEKLITDELNRHSILHEFGFSFNYNLENYLKVYFVIDFLCWAFLRKENKGILNEIQGFRGLEKQMAYRKIIDISNKLHFEKHTLYKNYDNYDSSYLKEKFQIIDNDRLNYKPEFDY
jgi:hypothetical protein